MTQKLEKSSIGKKSVFTNAYKVVPTKRGDSSRHLVPAYDEYCLQYGACDRFNKQLYSSTWPFRRGGGARAGEDGQQHDFAVGVVLMNTFNAYRSIHRVQKAAYSFETYCTTLATDIFAKYG